MPVFKYTITMFYISLVLITEHIFQTKLFGNLFFYCADLSRDVMDTFHGAPFAVADADAGFWGT